MNADHQQPQSFNDGKEVQQSACLSGTAEVDGDCCVDGPLMTGCGEGYHCASSQSSSSNRTDEVSTSSLLYYCEKDDPKDEEGPDRIPRSQLCIVPQEFLDNVYGFPVFSAKSVPSGMHVSDKNDKMRKDASYEWMFNSIMEQQYHGLAAYLSTMGAIDADDHSIVDSHSRVRRVVIVVHGSGRNAEDYLCSLYGAIPEGRRSTTMIIAPWFLTDEDPPVNLTRTGLQQDPTAPIVLRWIERGPILHTWRYGADAINSTISSYDVMDAMVEYIMKQQENRFPNLEAIVVTGHSAGGQYTQRWALLSNSWVLNDGMTDNKKKISATVRHRSTAATHHPTVAIRIVPANPRTFAYLDNRRFIDGLYKVPSVDFQKLCPWYNTWEWGLGNMTDPDSGNDDVFLPTPYRDRAIANAPGGVNGIVQRYARRDLIYLNGEQDTIFNGMPCQDAIQGPNRKVRGDRFYASLVEVYQNPPYRYDKPIHKHLVVPHVPHNHNLMYQSTEGQFALFDD